MNILEAVKKQSIKNVQNLLGKRIILRIDVNVPLGENGIVDEIESWRIIQSLPTLEFLQRAGAKIIILAHIGRDPGDSLLPIFDYMHGILNMTFIKDIHGEVSKKMFAQMNNGDIVMLENVRSFSGEKDDDISYLSDIIDISDMYVNDAFSVSHRKHASVHNIVKKLPSYFGLQFVDEITHLHNFLSHFNGTKVLILGGAKFGTKLSLLRKLLHSVDYVLVGGALAHVFLKARGFSIGKSFYDDVDISDIVHNHKIILPIDYIDQHGDVADIYDVSNNDIILDIGPATMAVFNPIIEHADSLMWNGPMGKYEDGYTEGSLAIVESIIKSETYSIVGGGDTSTLLLEHDTVDDFDFISTGGGAMLDFLVDEDLPGIQIILDKSV